MKKTHRKKIYINGRFLTQPITGVQRYGHELVQALENLLRKNKIDSSKYEFIILAPHKGILHIPAFKYISFQQKGYLTGHAWEQLELPFYARNGLLFCPGNTAPVLSLLLRKKTVVTVHDLSFRYFPQAYSKAFGRWYRIVIPMIFWKAQAVITVSESEKISILKHYPKANTRLTAIQNGGLPPTYTQTERKSEEKNKSFSLLYVGSLSMRKNFQGVLNAFKILNKKLDLTLLVAGGSSKTFNSSGFKIPTKIENKIIFKGQINKLDELISLYNDSNCLVFPSFYEASPLPPIEAMACGCPVIASAIPSLKERCGDAALYCDPDDPQDIADKISLLLENQNLRNSLINKGKKRAAQFNWENCALQTFRIFEQVLMNRGSDA